MTQDKGPTTYTDGQLPTTEAPFRGVPSSVPDSPSPAAEIVETAEAEAAPERSGKAKRARKAPRKGL